MHHDIPSIFVAAASAAAIALAGFLVVPFDGPWQMPSSWAWWLMTLSAACLFVANTAIIMALRTGEMSVTAPFRYVMVPMSILLGYWLWGDIPDALAWPASAWCWRPGSTTLHRERHGLTGKRAAARTAQPGGVTMKPNRMKERSHAARRRSAAR